MRKKVYLQHFCQRQDSMLPSGEQPASTLQSYISVSTDLKFLFYPTTCRKMHSLLKKKIFFIFQNIRSIGRENTDLRLDS